MIWRNLSGSTKEIFRLGLGAVMLHLGSITKSGILQGQDADQRITRDLLQVGSKSYLAEDETQLATEYEVHQIAPVMLKMEVNSTYILDPGATLVI